ncbi:MAG TPA: MraY family glycosyltransferase [Acidobacteriota bacterium]|nr:MraY family glycosyltransferase [Acidobacteriota bacterium]
MSVYAALTVSIAAVGLSLILTPIVRVLAPRIGAVDLPGPISAHTRPAARAGGLAIWIAGILALAGGAILYRPADGQTTLWLLPALGASLLVAVGLIDDIHRLDPRAKLLVGFAVAVAVSAMDWSSALTGSATLDVLISIGWLTIFPQAFNAFDGLDGLAAGCACLGFGFLGAWFFAAGDVGIAAAAWILAGATLGFLVYNFPPSRGIFLGDSGSLFLGFSLAFLSLRAVTAGGGNMTTGISLIPLFFVCIPVFEAIFVIVRRVLRGHSIFRGDRLHLYDEVHERLGSIRLVAVTYYAATILISALVWWIGATT